MDEKLKKILIHRGKYDIMLLNYYFKGGKSSARKSRLAFCFAKQGGLILCSTK